MALKVEATNRHKSVTGGAATVARLFAYWQLLTHESVAEATSAIGKCTMASGQWPLAKCVPISRTSSSSPSAKIAEKIKNNCQDTDKQSNEKQRNARDAGRCVWCDYIGFLIRWPKGQEAEQQQWQRRPTLTGQYWWKQDLYDNAGYIFKFNEPGGLADRP